MTNLVGTDTAGRGRSDFDHLDSWMYCNCGNGLLRSQGPWASHIGITTGMSGNLVQDLQLWNLDVPSARSGSWTHVVAQNSGHVNNLIQNLQQRKLHGVLHGQDRGHLTTHCG